MEKPRISRLSQIVTILQSKRLITARELAEKFNVSIRTIYRDIRTLENSGVPIVTEEGKGYVDNYTNAITKIKAVLKYSQKDKADLLSKRIIFRFNQEKEKSSNHLMKLQTAITNFQLLEIEYHSLQKKTTKRIVEPFAMYSTNLNWLLIAFCRLRNEFRAFRIDCITNMKNTEKNFEPHKMSLEEYFKICEEKYTTTPDKPLS